LYNWDHRTPPGSPDSIPQPNNIRTQALFTCTKDEEEFYLCSARIELRGVEILEQMRTTLDDVPMGDAIAVRHITEYLQRVASAIDELKELLLNVKNDCDPTVYYNEIRPWLRGEDASDHKRKWVFDLGDAGPELVAPTELSGPSAGQSALVHVLDIFLGVDHQPTSPGKPTFMSRMQKYMPKNHRMFLDYLKSNPHPLREFVMNAGDEKLLAAYNRAVLSLKNFRDAHMIIATLYILGPARRAAKLAAAASQATVLESGEAGTVPAQVKGTGGSDLVVFLKETRQRTQETVL
jgi:indoleamine 2,3-dioxygenase